MFVKYGYIFLCHWCAECSCRFSHFSSDESHMDKLVQHKYLIIPKDISFIRTTVGTQLLDCFCGVYTAYQCFICLVSRYVMCLQKPLCLCGAEEHHVHHAGRRIHLCEGRVHHQVHLGSEVSCCHVCIQEKSELSPQSFDTTARAEVHLLLNIHVEQRGL